MTSRAVRLDAHRLADRDVDLVGGGEDLATASSCVDSGPSTTTGSRDLAASARAARRGIATAATVNSVHTAQAISTTVEIATPT